MAWFGRPAQPVYTRLLGAQADACAALHRSAFAHGWSALEFERLLAEPSAFGDAALDAKTHALAGFVLSRGAAGEAEILTIAVSPAWRRRGIGRALLDRHVARLAGARIEALFLEVDETNLAARRLYAATGFVEVGRRKAYYQPAAGQPAAAALVLRLAIA